MVAASLFIMLIGVPVAFALGLSSTLTILFFPLTPWLLWPVKFLPLWSITP